MTDEDKLKNKTREGNTPPDRASPAAHKEDVRAGGIEADPNDPLGKEELRESYGAGSGKNPDGKNTPDAVTHND